MINLNYKRSDILNYNFFFLKEIQSICNPLFQNFPITHFLYKRVFQDGHYFLISSDFDVTKKLIEFINNQEDIFFENAWPIGEEIQKHIWSIKKHENSSISGLKILSSLGITHGLNTVLRRQEDKSIESITFATRLSKTDIYNFYLNNLAVFSRFIFYFKNRGSKIIENPMTKHLAYSTTYHLKIRELEQNTSQEDNLQLTTFKSFIEQTKVKKYILKSPNACSVTLSEMQIQCLYQLSRGKTAKEIARYFKISPRTVETHLNFVKEKLGVSSKACLLQYLSEDIKDFLGMEIQKKTVSKVLI